jgi:hypothetical protein
MAEPTVFDIINAQIRNVHSDLAPDGYFLSHDEIRMGGWDGVCDHTGKTPGEILGDNLRRCTSIIRKEHAPGIAGVFRKPLIYTWSDMFDPFHNAKTTGRYYYCKGDGPWKNSWNGLSSNVIIMNWLSGSTGTLNWFAGNSTTNGTLSVPCKQVLAGYYDGSVSGIDSWLNTAATIKNPDLTNSVIGVMYTTWAANYTDLEAFATEVSNYATPGTWPPPKLAP